jgi:hypothetical protein
MQQIVLLGQPEMYHFPIAKSDFLLPAPVTVSERSLWALELSLPICLAGWKCQGTKIPWEQLYLMTNVIETWCINILAPYLLGQNNSEACVLLWLSEHLRWLSSSCPQWTGLVIVLVMIPSEKQNQSDIYNRPFVSTGFSSANSTNHR